MSAKYYTLSELKQLALDSANTIGLSSAFTIEDSDKAYDYAVGVCGFENPLSSDSEYTVKQRYLLTAMEMYFLKDVQRKYLLKFDVGDLKLGQISRGVREMIDALEASLDKAKKDPAIAHLFIDASGYFGKLVEKPGILDDAVGQSVDPDEVE